MHFLRILIALHVSMAMGCQVLPPHPGSERAPLGTVPERGYDVEHYALELELLPELRRIEGSCTVRFLATVQNLQEITLDLSGLEVRSVSDAQGRALPFHHAGSNLRVDLGQPVPRGGLSELTIRYGGQPVEGLWFSETNTGSGATQVFTHGQADHARGWFPCFDHPSDRASSEIRVTLPETWTALAAGERIDVIEEKGRRTEHWRMTTPHPSYLASLVAGEFVVRESAWEGVPLLFAAEPVYADWLEASFEETGEILTTFSQITGIRYPYPKYSQVVVANFPWGGMENISATTLTPLTLGDERCLRDHPSAELVAHEAAHQWFGNLFTCRDWSHLWLNEGFATYMALLYFEATRGVDDFRARLRDAQQKNLEQDRGAGRRPTVWTRWKEPEDLMDTHSYEGAAARLHLLRFLLGDEHFFAGVRTYAAENAGKSVVTGDLQRALEKASGRDLDLFFEQWIYGRGYPEFELAWDWDEDQSTVVLDVRQVQAIGDGTPSVFALPVDVEVLDAAGARVHRVELRGRKQRFALPVTGRPLYVQFDKYGWIPKVVTWRRTGAEWLATAESDDDVNGRRDAVRALGLLAEGAQKTDPEAHETYVAALVHRLRKDDSPWVRAAAAEGLGRARGLEARERLVDAARSDSVAGVRVAALQALRSFCPSSDLASSADSVFEEGFSWATMGAAAGLFCSADPQHALEWIRAKLQVASPHDELRGYLFAQLGALEGRAAGEELRRWATDESIHPNARATAVRSLAGRSSEALENGKFLVPFLATEDFRLRKAAIDSLATIGDERARRALKAYYPISKAAGERRTIEACLTRRDA